MGGGTASALAARRRSVVIGDAVLLALSVVALVALATSGALAGRGDPIASAAPGLIALGAAVIAVHIVLLVCRLGVSASAHSDRVASFLALRQIARRPAVLRQARVLIIALCLACFASSAWSVSRSNRAAAATFGVGTSAVVTVTPQTGGARAGGGPGRSAGTLRHGGEHREHSQLDAAGRRLAPPLSRHTVAGGTLAREPPRHQPRDRSAHRSRGHAPRPSRRAVRHGPRPGSG